MDESNIQDKLTEYRSRYEVLVTETQELMKKAREQYQKIVDEANEKTLEATRLEGSIIALRDLLEEQ